MRANFQAYQELEQEAKEEFEDSKPLVARYLAHKPGVDGALRSQKYEEPREAIRNLAPPAPSEC